MKKIFYDSKISSANEKIFIEGKYHHHLANVLRVKINDSFIMGDIENKEFISSVIQINKQRITFQINGVYERRLIKYPEVKLYFSILKSDKNEIVIQKCSELGIDKIIPVITKNCVLKLDEITAVKKVEKWKNLAKESAMQSGRKKIMEIFPIVRFENIEKYDIDSLKIFGYINNKTSLISILKDQRFVKRISFFVGPEGDFTGEEIIKLQNDGWIGANLGQNILRSETSSIFLASSILFFYQEGIK